MNIPLKHFDSEMSLNYFCQINDYSDELIKQCLEISYELYRKQGEKEENVNRPFL